MYAPRVCVVSELTVRARCGTLLNTVVLSDKVLRSLLPNKWFCFVFLFLNDQLYYFKANILVKGYELVFTSDRRQVSHSDRNFCTILRSQWGIKIFDIMLCNRAHFSLTFKCKLISNTFKMILSLWEKNKCIQLFTRRCHSWQVMWQVMWSVKKQDTLRTECGRGVSVNASWQRDDDDDDVSGTRMGKIQKCTKKCKHWKNWS